jgi:hypothetical protein
MADEFEPAAATTADNTNMLFNLARGAKGIALLAFVLPFVTVSCAGQPLARITGLQLATGNIQPIGQNMPGAPATGGDYSFDIFALLAAVLIAAGLVLTFVLARRRAALFGMALSAVAAVVLIFDVFVRIKGQATAQLRESSGATPPASGAGGGEFEKQMQQQMEQMVQQISVDPAIGFWLCVLALIGAIVLNYMVRSRRAAL